MGVRHTTRHTTRGSHYVCNNRALCPRRLGVFQPDAAAARLPLGGVRGRQPGTGVPDRGVHRVAGHVLLGHHIGVLRGAAGRAVHTVRDHRAAPDGQPGRCGAEHESRRAPVPPASGAHARYRGRVVLPVPVAVPRAHTVDHTGATRVEHHGNGGRRELLSVAVLLPHHAIHQLGAQPHTVQPDVVQVPRRVPPAVRAAPRPVDRPPAAGPQGHRDHHVGARGRLGHRHHYYHHRFRQRRRQSEERERRRGRRSRGHRQHVHPDEAQRHHRHIGRGPAAPSTAPGPAAADRQNAGWRRHHPSVEPDVVRGRGRRRRPAEAAARELRLRRPARCACRRPGLLYSSRFRSATGYAAVKSRDRTDSFIGDPRTV